MNNPDDAVDKYVQSFPEVIQERLASIRSLIRKTAPDAIEGMAYGMPAYKLNGKPLVYFAGFKNHIGFYATPSGHEEFAEALSQFKHGKGSVQFSLDQPLPLELIERIVRFRVGENNFKS